MKVRISEGEGEGEREAKSLKEQKKYSSAGN
jgi:hypothetical protein